MHELTLGTATANFRYSSCTLTDVRYPSCARFRRHAHERAYLCLVLAGGFREECIKAPEIVEPGCVVVMPAGYRHEDAISEGGARSFVLTLDPSAAQ